MNAQLKTQVGAHAGLDGLLRARSIALVGATERSAWSNGAFANFGRLGYEGSIHVVNPNGGRVHGINAAPSCRALGEHVDAALLMVPMRAIEGVLQDLHEAGIGNAVILTSGFAEMGGDGAGRQASLATAARAKGIHLLGPNCLGFINFIDRVPIWTINLPTRLAGNVALVSQSGATASYIAEFAGRQGVGLSYIVSTGNEADLNVARVVDYMVDDEATRVICLFLETSRDAQTLAAAAQRALSAGKPVIALKIGTSEITAKSAQAHTGSLVGDDRVFDAACRQLGIIRVHSVDDLVATAGLLSQVRPRSGGVGVLAISGGICEVAADRAEVIGLQLAELSPPTCDALKQVMPDFGTPHNPLDLTGAAILEPSLFATGIRALASDPGVDLVACLFDMPTGPLQGYSEQVITEVGVGFSAIGKQSVLLSVTPRPVVDYSRLLAEHHGIAYVAAGVDRGLSAIASAQWWARKRKEHQAPHVANGAALNDARPSTERQTLDYLASHGVPVITARVATDAAQAHAIAHDLGGPVVLKIASPDIAHKSDVGGVQLNVSPANAADAYQQIRAAVAASRPDAHIDGVIISPMRDKGIELLVGIVRDPQWGLVLAVGLGGIWVELLKDTSLRLLPVTPDDVLTMLSELRASRLLDGYRGGIRVDRNEVAEVITRIGNAALALGPQLQSLEVNPLLATPGHVEALDGLTLWNVEDAP
ncbi:acetate--CoA ligase family protein [Stenotrophomonas sp. Iso1]|uniref:acetate--CoA ligase family protein n=1 Tax=Stenotrophomonas sp. Iso1 TaxID=2977283 RepID=UPI0022B7992E|nr:acetate--CoA ligase family protein [Stenotrophomonas sp. Iso1]